MSAIRQRVEDVLHFLRIVCVTQCLIAEYARTVDEIMRVNIPARRNQTILMYSILGASTAISLGTVIANRYHGRKAEEWVFGCLSPPFVLFIAELFADSDTVSLGLLVGLTLIAWIGSYIFASKESPGPEHEKYVITLEDLDNLNLPRYPEASIAERCLNMGRVVQQSAFSFAATFTLLQREWARQTEALPYWAYEILAFSLIIPAIVGYQLNYHPKFANRFLAAPVKFCEYFTFAYTAMSAWFSLVCSSDDIENHRASYTHICVYFAFMMGLFSAAKNSFDAERNHVENITLIETVTRFSQQLREKRTEFLCASTRFFKNVSQAMGSWKRRCCANENDEQLPLNDNQNVLQSV